MATATRSSESTRGRNVGWCFALAAALGTLAGCGGTEPSSTAADETVPATAQRAPAAAALPAPFGRYLLINALSNKCAEVADASRADGANIRQATCRDDPAQAFDITEVSPGSYKLSNAASGKVVDVAGASHADRANVQQWSENGSGAQRFALQRTQGNRYTLVNAGSGKCIDVAAASLADGANIQQFSCNGTGAQQFFLVPLGASGRGALAIGQYTLSAENSGLCLGIAEASLADGAKAVQSGCSGAASQRFEIVADLDSAYRLLNVASGKALDVSDVSTANGALIQQWAGTGGGNQRFLAAVSGDAWSVRASHSGKCIDVKDFSTAEGADIQQWDCSGNSNQRWRFVAAGEEPAAGTEPSFGANVIVFDPSMPATQIQAQLDRVFSEQESNQFGASRYALLFKPGRYQARARVGFYTQVLGLGAAPDDVTIQGAVQADAAWFGGNATQNFWRGAENLAIEPDGGTSRWAVSQGSPLRRLHVKGGLVLDDGGWSSGGFIADSKVDGRVDSGSQQQWLTRNSQLGGWSGGGWNMVFVGVDNAPSASTWPNPPYTVISQTPRVREKPFLSFSGGRYAVIVPELRQASHGPSWAGGAAPAQTISIEAFHIAQADGDSAATINAALAQGKHILFTPGVYRLNDTLRVTRANTVLLGLGLATLQADGGVTALQLADVDGVKVAGLLLDAGSTNSASLIDVGPPGSNADHAANPTSLHDLFLRVGGAAVGKATVGLNLRSKHVILDHAWVWRADHGSGVGWGVNTAGHGVVIDGDDATVYGLFVEHFQQAQTVWNGERGRLFFYQSEAPYDVPSQSSWMDGSANGYASYQVGAGVQNHDAWGLGAYCFFSTNRSVKQGSAIKAPTGGGIHFQHMTTLSLGGVGEITHVLNERGAAANAASVTARLAQ
jgi:hypothetical protein